MLLHSRDALASDRLYRSIAGQPFHQGVTLTTAATGHDACASLHRLTTPWLAVPRCFLTSPSMMSRPPTATGRSPGSGGCSSSRRACLGNVLWLRK